MTHQQKPEKLRLDKWLWAARFYKTRRLASDAISGGKVHLNGQRTKPSKEISPGAELSIHKAPYSWQLTVVAVNAQRRPASEAVLLYEESPESHAQRQAMIKKQREERSANPLFERRPNKKQRRQIHRFKQEP